VSARRNLSRGRRQRRRLIRDVRARNASSPSLMAPDLEIELFAAFGYDLMTGVFPVPFVAPNADTDAR
jgi:hypothetical protein